MHCNITNTLTRLGSSDKVLHSLGRPVDVVHLPGVGGERPRVPAVLTEMTSESHGLSIDLRIGVSEDTHGESKQGSEGHIERMVEVVTDSSERDVEGQHHEESLNERSDNLEIPPDAVRTRIRDRKPVQPGLEEESEEDSVIEGEGRVSRQEGESSFVHPLHQLIKLWTSFFCHLQGSTNFCFVRDKNEEFLFRVHTGLVVWLAESEEVRTESSNGDLGDLSDEKSGDTTEHAVTEGAVDVHEDPRKRNDSPETREIGTSGDHQVTEEFDR